MASDIDSPDERIEEYETVGSDALVSKKKTKSFFMELFWI